MSWRASSGLRAWLIQRATAIFMMLYSIYLLYFFISNSTITFHSWRDWVAMPFNRVGLSLFFFALLFHAWIGIRDVIMDYVKPFSLRVCVLFILATSCFGLGVWVLNVLNSVT